MRSEVLGNRSSNTQWVGCSGLVSPCINVPHIESSLVMMLLAGLFIVLLLIFITARSRRYHNLPGPPGFPLLGNVLDMPRSHASQRFADLRSVSYSFFLVWKSSPFPQTYGSCVLTADSFTNAGWEYRGCRISFSTKPRNCDTQLSEGGYGHSRHQGRNIRWSTSAYHGFRAVRPIICMCQDANL